MNGKSLMMLAVAVGLGLLSMTLVRGMIEKPAAEEEETREILVATRDLKEEEVLKAEMVKATRVAVSAVPAGAFASFKDVEERWVRTRMLEGDPIVEKKLGPKGTPPGLVSNIPKGMRAVAIEVNEQSGVSGFVLPGHRVDVISYDTHDKTMQQGECILQNVLVLAAGQIFTRAEEKAVQSRTVTVAVSPDDVGILVAAKAKGPVTLSLRGVNDHEVVKKPPPKPKDEGPHPEAVRAKKLAEDVERLKEQNAQLARHRGASEELEKLRKDFEALKKAPPKVRKQPEYRPVWIYRCTGQGPHEAHVDRRGAGDPDTTIDGVEAPSLPAPPPAGPAPVALGPRAPRADDAEDRRTPGP